MASWYGPGFNGRHTATGQIYNQEDLTAASNSFPLGSHVMVTNLNNGRSVEVLINDRGPFKKGRKIDLSHAAARSLGMLGTGTTRVSLAPMYGAQPETTIRYYVQAGSFSRRDSAEQLRDALLRHYSDVRIYTIEANDRRFYRVRMGAFTNREEAAARARQAAQPGLPMIIVSQ